MKHRSRHRGPHGIGSFREMCSRVVLDANCFRGLHVEELEAIQARGFSLHVSIEGFRETWARSLKEENYGLLEGRVRKLARLIDSRNPVAFVGHALFATIGRATAEMTARAGSFRGPIERAWATMCSRGITRDEWVRIGTELQNELDAEEADWLARVPEAIALDTRIELETARWGDFYDKDRGWEKTRQAIAGRAGAVTIPRVDRRAHAFLAFVVDKMRYARARRPSANDNCDARHLQHIAWPAFLLTGDRKLIETVDRVSRQQRAWVRTPIELIEDRIARSVPWGKPAEAIAERFARRPLSELRIRQEQWRARSKK